MKVALGMSFRSEEGQFDAAPCLQVQLEKLFLKIFNFMPNWSLCLLSFLVSHAVAPRTISGPLRFCATS